MTEDLQQQSLRQYLLGAPLEADQRRLIEERLLTDDEFCEQIEIVEDELIEQYLVDELNAAERVQFEEHFLSTNERREKLRVARAVSRYVTPKAAPRQVPTQTNGVDPIAVATRTDRIGLPRAVLSIPWWSRWPKASYAGLAAALVLIVFGGLLWRSYSRKSDIERGLVALNEAYLQQRPSEARITGLEYAPAPATRGASDKFDYAARDRAERLLHDAANEQKTPAALHALGRLYLAERQYDKAIGQFEAALASAPNDAQLLSDFGAALMERGGNHPSEGKDGAALSDYARALEHLNRALAINPSLVDAVFNRALLYQRMNLPRQAAAEWRHYLQLDPNSPWAEEATRKLKLLEERQAVSSAAPQTLNEFLDAYRSQDDERAWQVLSGSREMISGQMVPFQIARTALQADAERKRGKVNELFNALKYAGALERNRSDDAFFAELAKYYSATGKAERKQLALAHAELSEGYRLCKASHYDEARIHFANAKSLFKASGNTHEARLTDYWLAYCNAQADRLEESAALLDELANFCRQRSYRWLLSQALYSLSNNQNLLGDHSRSLTLARQSLEIADSIGDTYNQQKVLTQLALQYTELGRPQYALEYNQRTLSIAASAPSSPRQEWRTFTYTAQTFYMLRNYEAAVAYAREALSLSVDELRDPSLTHFSQTRLGMILAGMGQYDEAIRQAAAGLEVARSVGNDSASRKMIAYSLLQLGHLTRQSGDCTAALEHYDHAVKMYDNMEIGKLDGYDAHKGRLLCYVNLEDDSAIESELRRVLELFEQDRAAITEEQNRNSFFDAEQDVYDIAITYAYARGDKDWAFNYSEQSRARSLLDLVTHGVKVDPDLEVVINATASPPDLSVLKTQLPAGAQVVQYTVLKDRLLIWFLSSTRLEVFERPITAAELNAHVLDYVKLLARNDESQAAELKRRAEMLYELLVAPVKSLLDNTIEVCIVPDKVLFRLPFAALVVPSTGQYLVEDYTLLFAPSVSVLVHCSQRAQQRALVARAETVLSVGNPTFDRASYPQLGDLPAAEVEAKKVAELYGGAALTNGRAQKALITERLTRADVIHFAGHYLVDERTPMRSRLLLARDTLTAAEVFGKQLPQARLVVLSACDTLLEAHVGGEGMVGLARTFLAAGAPVVVASEWPVDSDATADLMIRFHQLRKEERLSTTLALRRAQQEMLGGSDKRYRNPYYWAAFLPIGGHADY